MATRGTDDPVVLIVEDSFVILLGLQTEIGTFAKVLPATNPVQARDLYGSVDRVDLVLLDGDLGRFGTAELLAEKFSQTCGLVISMTGHDHLIEPLLVAGCDDHCPKHRIVAYAQQVLYPKVGDSCPFSLN